MMRQAPSALLIDFDGVLRTYDPSIKSKIEREYGLEPGTVLNLALDWQRLLPAITGHQSRAEWLAGVADLLAERVGGAQAAATLIAGWDAYRGEIDPGVLAFVREVRAAGLRVCLATNATDDLDEDLAALGVADEFDAVANSFRLGSSKPSKEYFAAACELLGVPPLQCLFIDDADRNVRGARVAGLSAYRYDPPDDLRYARAALGLPA